MKRRARIMVTFHSMRYPNTGFFFFGKSLSQALTEQNTPNFNFSFYSHRSVPRNLYPPGVRIINKSLIHKILFPYRFDLVHFSDQYCKPHPRLVTGKKILTIHDINPYYDRLHNPAKLKRYVSRIRSYIRACHHVVTISEFVKQEVLRYFPEATGKISVIHNGADKLELPSEHSPAYKPSRKFLFTIGMLTPKKNFHVLPCLLENNEMELVIAGIIKEDYQIKILEEAKKYQCEERVKIIGTITDKDKAWYYQHCYAFMFPSLAEGFGLPVIEAMHFGKPVFLSTSTSLPEIGGKDAFYFESFEPEKMQEVFWEKIKRFTDAPELKCRLIDRARSFSWIEAAKIYIKLYSSLLE